MGRAELPNSFDLMLNAYEVALSRGCNIEQFLVVGGAGDNAAAAVGTGVVEDGKAKYVEVTQGLMGSGVTQIPSGLTAGQELVTVGQSYLSDGDPVRVVSGEG